jgi:hypothetical protein
MRASGVNTRERVPPPRSGSLNPSRPASAYGVGESSTGLPALLYAFLAATTAA